MTKSIIKIYLLTSIVIFFGLTGCQKENVSTEKTSTEFTKASVTENGKKIKFEINHPSLKLFKTQSVEKKSTLVEVIAPARVVACMSNAVSTNDKIILFEISDITSIYSLYKQTKINLAKAGKNLDRIKDMFISHTATQKDITDAETDVSNAQTSMNEMEGKLRTLGYNPVELEKSLVHTVWIISDVSESQIKDVQKGEKVKITFTSFPDKMFSGLVESIGEVVDPISRTLKVRVILTNNSDKIVPGMFARVDFGDPIKDVIVLPQSSLITVDSKDYVFVKTGEESFERREVSSAFSANDKIVITRGIQSNELVVTEGAILLKGLSFGF